MHTEKKHLLCEKCKGPRRLSVNEDRKSHILYTLEVRNPDASVTSLGSIRCINDQRARTTARNRIKREQDALNPYKDIVLTAGSKEVWLTDRSPTLVEDLILPASLFPR